MNIKELKARIIAKRHQLVHLDRHGRLVKSCDSLMPLQHLRGTNLLETFQVFEGLMPDILALQPGDATMHLPMMGFIFEGKPYRLTLEFWAESDIDGILWLMSTEDIPTAKLSEIQQDRNETYIGLENLTEQEKTLRDYTTRLEHALNSLQRFSYVVSHDLKTPLRAIGNLATWIGEAIEAQDYTELPEYLNLLRNRVSRMEGLIEGLLLYHRAGRERQQPEPLDLQAMIQELHETIFVDRSCQLTIAPNLPILFCCRTALYQILSNLLTNVYRYAGGDNCQVQITYAELPQHHQIGVIDNGPGIAPKHHQHIFEIFQTLQSKDENESSGIGLSIVQRIVTEAGGTVWVESELGAGAAFYFTWPKQKE
jgi:signal transduction histidine kinase